MDNEEAKANVFQTTENQPAAVDLGAFQKDCVNPFEIPFCESDVVLIVEGKKLHVHKSILSVHSPVFHKMFYGDFAEKESEEIEIKSQKHHAMVTFLKQMYPVFSFEEVADDAVLMDILPLADFYQSDHVRIKCEAYIGQQVSNPNQLSADRKMLYLFLCDAYGAEKHFDAILDLAAQLTVSDIQKYYFGDLRHSTQIVLLAKRCQVAENLSRNKLDPISEPQRTGSLTVTSSQVTAVASGKKIIR